MSTFGYAGDYVYEGNMFIPQVVSEARAFDAGKRILAANLPKVPQTWMRKTSYFPGAIVQDFTCPQMQIQT